MIKTNASFSLSFDTDVTNRSAIVASFRYQLPSCSCLWVRWSWQTVPAKHSDQRVTNQTGMWNTFLSKSLLVAKPTKFVWQVYNGTMIVPD